MTAPIPSAVRFKVEPGDVPPEKAARRLHLTLAEFNGVLPKLLARGFPPPDPDTHMYDLEAIDQWRKLRSAPLFGLTHSPAAEQSANSPSSGMGDRFAATKRGRNG